MSRIAGTVRYDADGNGVGEMPTPNVRVTAQRPDGAVMTAVSDAAGAFQFNTVLVGEYRVFIAARDLPPRTAAVVGTLVVLFDGAPFDAADFVLEPAASGRTAQAVELLRAGHAAVAATLCWSDETLEQAAAEALGMCDFAGEGELTTAQVRDLKVTLAVVVWRRVEAVAALGFDYDADGGSFKRSQLAKQATAMRVRAEDQAWRLGICGFGAPAVELGFMPLLDEADCLARLGGWA
jgi:hypothetical protein